MLQLLDKKHAVCIHVQTVENNSVAGPRVIKVKQGYSQTFSAIEETYTRMKNAEVICRSNPYQHSTIWYTKAVGVNANSEGNACFRSMK